MGQATDAGSDGQPGRWTRDRVVAIVGALAIVLAIAGLAIVEARTGPFDHRIDPATASVSLSGTIQVTAGGPAGTDGTICMAGPPVCQDPTTEVDLELTGLPVLRGSTGYAGFLIGSDQVLPLGALTLEGGSYHLETTEAADGRDLDRLVIRLTQEPDPESPSPLVVLEVPVDLSDGAAELADRFEAGLGSIQGQLSVAQIGAVEVSSIADTRVEGLVSEPGWSYRAWFVDDEVHTPLGELSQEEDGAWTLDARVEHVILADQDRFLVTVEPEGSSQDVVPAGFPVLDVDL